MKINRIEKVTRDVARKNIERQIKSGRRDN